MNPEDPYVPPCHVHDGVLRQELIRAQIQRTPVVGTAVAAWNTVITTVNRVRGYGYGSETVTAGVERHLLVPTYALEASEVQNLLTFDVEGKRWGLIPHTDVWRIEPYVEPAAIDQAITEITSSSE